MKLTPQEIARAVSGVALDERRLAMARLARSETGQSGSAARSETGQSGGAARSETGQSGGAARSETGQSGGAARSETGQSDDRTGHVLLTSVAIDSRQAGPGSLFVALPGERTDGHDYVAHAFSRGAQMALVGRPVEAPGVLIDVRPLGAPEQAQESSIWEAMQAAVAAGQPVCLWVDDPMLALQRIATAWRARFNPRVVGITGSVGKTTTKEITAAVLRQRFVTLKNPGNQNNEIGLPLTVLELNEQHQMMVLEMGMYDVGEIAQLCRIARPHVGVITNIGPVHLERLGSMERIVQAKTELVQALPADGVAVLNADDPLVAGMASQTQARVFWYGLTPPAGRVGSRIETAGHNPAGRVGSRIETTDYLWADEIESEGLDGIRFRFHYQGDVLHVRAPLLGRHSVHTALRAAAVGLVEGLSWEEIVRGMQQLDVQLRLIAARGLNGATLLDDTYNASPASTMAALNLLADLPVHNGRRIAVLGDMLELGSYEEEGHRKVGVRAADVVDLLVTVGQRARLIAEEALAAGLPAGRVLALANAQAALAELRSILGPGDVVLVKGSRAVHMDDIATALTEQNDDR